MNNKIQKFQYGGPVTLQYKEPEVYIEEALAQSIQQYKARLESERRERQFDKELTFKQNEAARKDQLDRHKAALLAEAQKRGDYISLTTSNLPPEEELSYYKRYDKDNSMVPILEKKIKIKNMVTSKLGAFSAMATEEYSPDRLNDMLMQSITPILQYRGEEWAQPIIDDYDNIKKNMTSQSILNKLGQNPDFKRIVGDILPSYDMSNASAVLSSVPAMWNMFSGTNKEKISALKSMLPFANKLSEQGYIDESTALFQSVNTQIGILTGLIEERVPAEKDFVPQKPEFQVKEDAEYIITDPTGKSFFGTSSQARLIGRPGLEKGTKQEVERFRYTKTKGAREQEIFLPGDPGYNDWTAAINKHKQMLVGEPGYIEVTDSKGNEYTWMGQSIEEGPNKRRFNVHNLKSLSGKEIKVSNQDLVGNYRKLVIQRPDTRIDDICWNRLNDVQRGKVMSSWDNLSIDERAKLLSVWNLLPGSKKISAINSM